MNYRYLSEQLRTTADAVAEFFKQDRGIAKFKVEEEVTSTLDYRPTLNAITQDHHYLCIDVLEGPYSPILDSVVLQSIQQSLPVVLYVAFPANPNIVDYKRNVDQARKNGVGVLEVSPASIQVIYEAIPLSLAGVRPIEKSKFPAKYRAALASAESTFKNGNPAKGCSVLYDEIENLSRNIAKKTMAKNSWRPLKPGQTATRLDLDTGPWTRVMEMLMNRLDWKKVGYLKSILQRVVAITPHRNESGHKPKSLEALVQRNRELRTRFENATDILHELIKAARPLRV